MKWYDTDDEFDLMRERMMQEDNCTRPPPPLKRHVKIKWDKEPAYQLSWRAGIVGWYEDFSDLAKHMDACYGVDQWAVQGRELMYQYEGEWRSYYSVRKYTSGRYFVYDESKD